LSDVTERNEITMRSQSTRALSIYTSGTKKLRLSTNNGRYISKTIRDRRIAFVKGEQEVVTRVLSNGDITDDRKSLQIIDISMFCVLLHISGTHEARVFKFCTQRGHIIQVLSLVTNHPKRSWPGLRDSILIQEIRPIWNVCLNTVHVFASRFLRCP